MTFFEKTLLAASVVSVMAYSSVATAEEGQYPNVYVGGQYGYLSVDNDDFDDNDDAYGAYIGTRFNEYVGIEGGYIDFGSQSNDLASVDVNGYTASIVGYLPVADSFNLYGKVGALFWDTEVETVIGNYGSDGEDALWAVGGQLALTERVDVRLEYTRFKVKLNNNDVDDAYSDSDYDLNYLSVGAQYNF